MKRLIPVITLLLFCIIAVAQQAPDYSEYILTPKASEAPRINGPKVYGSRPGTDFLYKIPVSGVRPVSFSAKGLPAGLKLDKAKGIISGKARRKGTYKVQISVSNALGSDSRELRIEIGDRIALTPPMGWNSWNCWGDRVTADNILGAARALERSGLADYGNTIDNSNPANRHRVIKFRLPSLSDGELVVLKPEDALENYLIEEVSGFSFNPIGQGLYVLKNKLYMPTGDAKYATPSILYIWYLAGKSMEVVDLSQCTAGELEDISIYRGRFIVQGQDGLFIIKSMK